MKSIEVQQACMKEREFYVAFLERLEKCFETYCNVVLYLFIKDYASYYYDNFEEKQKTVKS